MTTIETSENFSQVENIPENIDLSRTVNIVSETRSTLSELEMKEFEEIERKIVENEKKLALEGCFNFNNDGSIEFTDKLIGELESWYKYCKENNIKFKDAEVKPIEALLEGIINLGEPWVIEYNINDKIETYKFSENSNLSKILGTILNSINYGCSIKNIKIFPNYLFGDKDELRYIKEIDNTFYSYDIAMFRLQYYGITIEDTELFFDKYKGTKNRENRDEREVGFFENFLNTDMLEFIFGAEPNNLKKILPINVLDGIFFYKLKNVLGGDIFNEWIVTILNDGVLNNESSDSIPNIIKSNVSADNLQGYSEICRFLFKNGIKKFPDLQGLTIDEYMNILKYIKGSNKSFLENFKKGEYNFKTLDTLIKSNMPCDVLCYLNDSEKNPEFNNLFNELFENEYGRELYKFLSKYPQKLKNLGGKKIKEIKLNTDKYNFCFRGILEMIKSIGNINIPILGKDFTDEEEDIWRKSWENIIKTYENVLRNYIGLDMDENGNQKPKKETFDKIFFANAVAHNDEDRNGVFQGKYNIHEILESFTNNFEDCSNLIDEDGNLDQTNQKNMINNIKIYVESHPNEKILVYLGYHGGKDGNSSNSWEKEDRGELADISENIQIMSPRCYFGGGYTGDKNDPNYIYGRVSSVSGYSTNTPTEGSVTDWMWKGYNKGLGFHELEIYIRLHYNFSFTPLTDFIDYTDFNTGEEKHGKIGLADAGNGKHSNNDVYYG